MKAPSLFEQTGWKRPYPKMLCQELAILRKVTQWDFDLGNAAFCRYAQSRGVLHLAGTGNRMKFTADFSKGREDYLADRHWWLCEPLPVTGERVEIPRETVESHFDLVLMARARLQDAWELFQAFHGPQGLLVGGV